MAQIRSMQITVRSPQGVEGAEFDVTVDWDKIIFELAQKAHDNKGRKATECKGAVVVEFIGYMKPL